MLNRFANIFWHYYGGVLVGFRQKLWPLEQTYSLVWQLAAVALYLAQLGWLLFADMPPVPRLGLALILFSPQWLYTYPWPHPVFEYRAYGMAIGLALLLASFIHPFVLVPLFIFWTWRSTRRRAVLTDPLRFWKCAQEKELCGKMTDRTKVQDPTVVARCETSSFYLQVLESGVESRCFWHRAAGKKSGMLSVAAAARL